MTPTTPHSMIATARWLALAVTLCCAGGCGLKGPLYLPPPELPEGQPPAVANESKPKGVSLKQYSQSKEADKAAQPQPAYPSPSPNP